MFDANAFSLDAFDEGSWMFLLETCYLDLSGKQRIYVRSILDSAYSSTDADQIIATAARNAISVLDAAIAMRVNTEPLQIVVAAEKKRSAPKQAVEQLVRQPKTQERKNKPAYVVAAQNTLAVSDQSDTLIASAESQQIVASVARKQLFVRAGKEAYLVADRFDNTNTHYAHSLSQGAAHKHLKPAASTTSIRSTRTP